jgi:uncharacterized protein
LIIPDINLLVYAHNAAAPLHSSARQWWEELVMSEQPIGMPWAVSLGFIRLVTHPAVLTEPLEATDATGRVAAWFEQPSVQPLDPGPRHFSILLDLFRVTRVAASLTTDAHIAAIAIEHQCEVHSNDSDFDRFPGLRWRNPLRRRRQQP